MNDMRKYFSDEAQFQRIASEAAFGFSELTCALEELPDGANILEVGSGTGYLAALVSNARPTCRVHAIEPVGSGFSAFEHAMKLIANDYPNVDFSRTTAENFDPGSKKFDLIFSVNVFEHIDNWPSSFEHLCTLLKPTGQMIILCPNYTVPYESHFGIPILGSPKLTRRLFAKRIATVEKTHDAAGLWNSLNFIKSTQLSEQSRKSGAEVEFDRAIMTRMFRRLLTDPQFSERQGAIASVAKLAFRLGAGGLLCKLPVRFAPYMKAHVALAKDPH